MNKNEAVKTEEIYINNRIVERLTQALVFNLNIPNGMHLVSGIGNGDEENNMAAVKTWVMNQHLNNNNFKSAEALLFLEDKLSNALCELKTRHTMYS